MPKLEANQILLNGNPHALPATVGLVALLEELKINPRFLVVEKNGDPVGRDDFAATKIVSGDRLELVRPVAGG